MELTAYLWFTNPGLVLACFLLVPIIGILSSRNRILGYCGLAMIMLIPFIVDVRYFLSYSHQIDVLGPRTALLAIPITLGRLVIALLLFSAGARLGRATLSVSLIAISLAIVFVFAAACYLLGKSYQQGYFTRWKNIGHPAEIQTIFQVRDKTLAVITTDARVFEVDFLYSCGGQVGNEPTRNACWYSGPTHRRLEPMPSAPCWTEFYEPPIPENATLVQHTTPCYADDPVAMSTWVIVLDGDIWVWWVRRDKNIFQFVMLTEVVLGSALGLYVDAALSTKQTFLRLERR